MIRTFYIGTIVLALAVASPFGSVCQEVSVADNMLLFQRSVGGWPKHYHDEKIDYTETLSASERAGVMDDSSRNDATIDNQATTKEIRYLLKACKKTGDKKYLASAERGIEYLLKAQYENGGWPQFYPDHSAYRGHITYNDDAMVNVLNLLFDLVQHKNYFDIVDTRLIEPSRKAVDRGVDCILKTQVTVQGKLTAWCAQHDEKTYLPAKARAFELVSLSGMESVGIVLFLMRVEQPTEPIKNAIKMAIEWFDVVKIKGYDFVEVDAEDTPKGIDRLMVKDPNSMIWARFYEIDTNEPFVCGRDGVKKKNVADIDYERRTGYAWYGKWAKKLFDKNYPEWQKRTHS